MAGLPPRRVSSEHRRQTIHVNHFLNLTGFERILIYMAALLTNHAHVLLCVAGQPGARIRDIATCVDLTERATHRLLCELEDAGYLTRHRAGRRNYYELHADQQLQEPLACHLRLGDLLAPLLASRPATRERPAA